MDDRAFPSRPGRPTLVIGLGNPLLGDDGVGWRVAEQVQKAVQDMALPVEVDCLAVGGLRLMERLIGYENVILIDALTTGRMTPGSVLSLSLGDLPDYAFGHLGSTHDTTLQTALRMGRALGAPLPEQITVVGIEAQRVYDFTEELTPPVAAAIASATVEVMAALRRLSRKEEDYGIT